MSTPSRAVFAAFAAATLLIPATQASGAQTGASAAQASYTATVTFDEPLPQTASYDPRVDLHGVIDFGQTFQTVSSVCFTAVFATDLLDAHEEYGIMFADGSGFGQANNGPGSMSSASLCSGPIHVEANALFLDGSEAFTVIAVPQLPDYSVASYRLTELRVTLEGTASADDCTISGTAAADRLVGTPGADVICGFGGADTIYGYGGDDIIIGGPGKDVLYGGAGKDQILGGPDGDEISGGPDQDTLRGEAGWDRLFGGDGQDYIFGGDDRDYAAGGPGNDQIDLGPGGNQTAYGDGGDDYLGGGESADRLFGGDGDDALAGFAGDDKLYGGDGMDSLLGSSGVNWMCGGAGTDHYTYTLVDRICAWDRGDL